MAQSPRVRSGAHTPEGKANLLSYREGVRVMKERSSVNAFDTMGWFYQALIHGIVTRQPRDTFLNAVFAEVPDTDPFRQLAFASVATCPHADPAFLAWHRLYVYFFERIVREASGDPSFTLPYWDYTLGGQQARLPVEFLEPVGNSPLENALYNWARPPGANGRHVRNDRGRNASGQRWRGDTADWTGPPVRLRRPRHQRAGR